MRRCSSCTPEGEVFSRGAQTDLLVLKLLNIYFVSGTLKFSKQNSPSCTSGRTYTLMCFCSAAARLWNWLRVYGKDASVKERLHTEVAFSPARGPLLLVTAYIPSDEMRQSMALSCTGSIFSSAGAVMFHSRRIQTTCSDRDCST